MSNLILVGFGLLILMLRLGISLYTHRRSVAVVLLLLLLLRLTSRRMLSSVALFTDLMAVYIEVGVALTLLLHRS